MKTGIIIAIIVAIAMTGLAVADKQPGAVVAVSVDGSDQLYPGTEVYITTPGESKLVPDSPFSWDIYDMDVTCPPNPVITPGVGCAKLLKHGTGGTTNSDGKIIPYQDSGWQIPNGDYKGHNYKLVVTIDSTNDEQYADVYTKVDSFEPIPELTTIVLVSAGMAGLFIVARKHRKNS